METLNLIISIVQVILAVAVILLVLLQQGKNVPASPAPFPAVRKPFLVRIRPAL